MHISAQPITQFHSDSPTVEDQDPDLEGFIILLFPSKDISAAIASGTETSSATGQHNQTSTAHYIDPAADGPTSMLTGTGMNGHGDDYEYPMKLLEQQRSCVNVAQKRTPVGRFVAYENRIERIFVLGRSI